MSLSDYLKEFLFCIVAAFIMAWNIPYPGKLIRLPIEIDLESKRYVEAAPMPDKNRIFICKQDPECMKLAEIGYFEARSESDKGVYAVMHSVVNRVRQRNFGNSIEEVANVKGHYSYLWDGSIDKGYTEPKQLERMLVMAYKVLNYESDNPIGQADHYHVSTMTTSWSRKMRHVATIGNHSFFR